MLGDGGLQFGASLQVPQTYSFLHTRFPLFIAFVGMVKAFWRFTQGFREDTKRGSLGKHFTPLFLFKNLQASDC